VSRWNDRLRDSTDEHTTLRGRHGEPELSEEAAFLTPAIFGVTGVPNIFGHTTLSPQIFAPSILAPYAFGPTTLSPQVFNPQILCTFLGAHGVTPVLLLW
jgi:hypothetical protein